MYLHCPECRALGRNPWNHEPHCAEGREQRRSWYFTAAALLLLLLAVLY